MDIKWIYLTAFVFLAIGLAIALGVIKPFAEDNCLSACEEYAQRKNITYEMKAEKLDLMGECWCMYQECEYYTEEYRKCDTRDIVQLEEVEDE